MQRMRPEERREFQRLSVNPPIQGTLGSYSVAIHEIGVLGARVTHEDDFDTDQLDLRFSYAGQQIEMRCQIARTAGGGAESGLRFVAAIGQSGDKLRDML